jgi:hypothetical protein
MEYGRPAGENGCRRTTTKGAEFAPLDIKVEWKVLPKALMYAILEIPDKHEHLKNSLAGTYDFDDPPDYVEYFWRRRNDYAELGLQVATIAKTLREHAGMPIVVPKEGDWNREVSMNQIIAKVNEESANCDRRVAENAENERDLLDCTKKSCG